MDGAVFVSWMGIGYWVVEARAFRASMHARDARLEHATRDEARQVLRALAGRDSRAVEQLGAAARGLPSPGLGHFRPAGLGGFAQGCDELVRALGDGSNGDADVEQPPMGARLYVLRPRSTDRSRGRPRDVDVQVSRLFSPFAHQEVQHRGRGYRLSHAALLARLRERAQYEALGANQALVLLREMAEDTARPEPERVRLQALLAWAAEPFAASDLVVLERVRIHASVSPEPAVTPSALRREAEQHWIVIETVSEQGEPVAGIQLQVVLAQGGTTSLRSQADGRARLDRLAPGVVVIRVPGLDGSAWRPETGAAARASGSLRAAKKHVVAKGESLARIARQHGLKTWKQLWDEPANEPLRQKRKNPHVIHPGDEVFVPAARTFEIERDTNGVHRLVVSPPESVEFRVVLQDHNQQPFLDEAYELRVDTEPDAEPRRGVTDGDGRLIEQVPATTELVRVTLPAIGLVWRFRLSELVARPSDDAALHRGEPNAVTEAVRATQMRLNALGFPCGAVDGVMNARTREALALAGAEAHDKPDGDMALAALDKLEPMFEGLA